MDFSGSVQTPLLVYGLMAVIAVAAAVIVQGIVYLLQRKKEGASGASTSASVSTTPALDEKAAHIAAIAAAVYAVLGAHRLVHIGEAARGPGWTTTGRLVHHASHAPRHGGR